MRLPIRVATAIRQHRLIPPEASVLVALSGGPDSVALLRCLLELSRKRDLRFKIHAAHLNHRLRGTAADADADFCFDLCRSFRVPYLEAACQIGALARKLKRSIEETGRIARHRFLAEAAQRLSCTQIATAHHADDRIETVLYRLCRGSGLKGLSGIDWTGPVVLEEAAEIELPIAWSARTTSEAEAINTASIVVSQVVRPLLGLYRQHILGYLQTLGQEYRIDATNADTRIPRNALRHEVLPLLEQKVHPGVRASLWRLAEEAAHLAGLAPRVEFWESMLEAVQREPERLSFKLPGKLERPDYAQLRAFVELVNTSGAPIPLTAAHFRTLADLFSNAGHARCIELNGLRVRRKAKLLIVEWEKR